MTKRYVLTTEISRVKAKHPPFELQIPACSNPDVAGESFAKSEVLVASAELMPDHIMELATTAPVRAAQLLLGDKYAHYKAAGGTAAILFKILEEHAKADLGESSASDGS